MISFTTSGRRSSGVDLAVCASRSIISSDYNYAFDQPAFDYVLQPRAENFQRIRKVDENFLNNRPPLENVFKYPIFLLLSFGWSTEVDTEKSDFK